MSATGQAHKLELLAALQITAEFRGSFKFVYSGHCDCFGNLRMAFKEALDAQTFNISLPDHCSAKLHLDTCYAAKFAENFQEVVNQGELKATKVSIFAWCRADDRLEWGQVSPLFKAYSYENGRLFKDQSEDWKSKFADHVNLYGFAYAKFYRANPSKNRFWRCNSIEDPDF